MYISGTLLVALAATLPAPGTPSSSPPLILTDRRVEVVVTGDVALSQEFQALINPSGIRFDAVRVSQLPDSGSLRDAQLLVGGVLLPGVRTAVAEAFDRYARERDAGRTVGLVTVDAGELKLWLSGVGADESVGLRFGTAHPVEVHGTDRRFALPASVVPKDLERGVTVYDIRLVGQAPIDKVSVEGLDLPATVEQADPQLVTIRARQMNPVPRDVVISYRVAATEQHAQPFHVDLLRPWVQQLLGEGPLAAEEAFLFISPAPTGGR